MIACYQRSGRRRRLGLCHAAPSKTGAPPCRSAARPSTSIRALMMVLFGDLVNALAMVATVVTVVAASFRTSVPRPPPGADAADGWHPDAVVTAQRPPTSIALSPSAPPNSCSGANVRDDGFLEVDDPEERVQLSEQFGWVEDRGIEPLSQAEIDEFNARYNGALRPAPAPARIAL